VKVQIWNAFASNNSGSYTLVGSFPEESLAAEVAAELARVSAEHEAWIQEWHQKGWSKAPSPSPLEAFVLRHGLTRKETGAGLGSDWPTYGQDNTPVVWAMGHQVFVHHDYTLTLPAAYGEFFYKRGGRVDVELEHTHHPLAAVFNFWFPYEGRAGRDVPMLARQLLDALYAEDGPLVRWVAAEPLPAWRVGEDSIEGDLRVGVVFDKLPEGFAAMARIAGEHGFRTGVKLFESWTEKGDPLAFLRPCHPPLPGRELFDVVLTGAGHASDPLLGVIAEVRGWHGTQRAKALLDEAPVPLRRRLPRSVAEEMAGRLQRSGATVEVRPCRE